LFLRCGKPRFSFKKIRQTGVSAMTDHEMSRLIAEAHAARAEYMRGVFARLFRRHPRPAVPQHS